MRMLILGPSCYGYNLANHLLEVGHEITGIGRSPFNHLLSPKKFPYWQHNLIHEFDYVKEVIKDISPNIIINYAAQGESAASFGHDNWRYYETNCVAMTRLAEWLYRDEQASKNLNLFVQISTGEVYGSTTYPAKEDHPLASTSPYALSKATFDTHLMQMAKHGKLPAVVIRPCNILCPGQQLYRIAPKALYCAMHGEKFQLHGGGLAQKSFIDVFDLNSAIKNIIDANVSGEIYNCSPDEASSIREIVDQCASVAGVEAESLFEIKDQRHGEDSCYLQDSSKLKGLGWKISVDVDESIRRVWNWMLSNQHSLHLLPSIFYMRG